MNRFRRCAIKNCYPHEGKLFKFPQPGTEKYDRWLQKCSFSRLQITRLQNPLICAKHFEKKCFGKAKLYIDAEPTLFLSDPENIKQDNHMQSTLMESLTRTETENKELHIKIKGLKIQNSSYRKKANRLSKRNKLLNDKREKLLLETNKRLKKQESENKSHTVTKWNKLKEPASEIKIDQRIKVKQEKLRILQSQLNNNYQDDDDYHFLMSFRHPLEVMQPQVKIMFCTKLKALLNSFTSRIETMTTENINNYINT